MSQKIKRGDIIDVKITGIQPYGAFASLPDNSTGLIHISEISDKFFKASIVLLRWVNQSK